MVLLVLQSLVFLHQPPKPAPGKPHAPASRGRLCCRRGLTAPYYSHRWPGPAATTSSHRSRTSEPSYSSPSGLPLPRLPRLRVVPFLGLAVIHRPGALDGAWSMWSRNDFHRKALYVDRLTAGSTAATRNWLLITCKIIIPPPDSRDPPDGPPYLAKKTFPPDYWDPPDGPTYFAKKNVCP